MATKNTAGEPIVEITLSSIVLIKRPDEENSYNIYWGFRIFRATKEGNGKYRLDVEDRDHKLNNVGYKSSLETCVQFIEMEYDNGLRTRANYKQRRTDPVRP